MASIPPLFCRRRRVTQEKDSQIHKTYSQIVKSVFRKDDLSYHPWIKNKKELCQTTGRIWKRESHGSYEAMAIVRKGRCNYLRVAQANLHTSGWLHTYSGSLHSGFPNLPPFTFSSSSSESCLNFFSCGSCDCMSVKVICWIINLVVIQSASELILLS